MLLAFSGRDSLCCWLRLRAAGIEIIPYFLYTVPGLSYDDEMLAYYERFFNTPIIRLPHHVTYNLLRCGTWQTLDGAASIYRANLPRYDFKDVENHLAGEFGLPDSYLCSVGMKAADNAQRFHTIRQRGTIGRVRHYYYTIWDWNTAQVKEYLAGNGVKLSKSYLYFGSTGDGIDYRFLRFLKDKLPQDYQRVLDVFPLAELELFRYEVVSGWQENQ